MSFKSTLSHEYLANIINFLATSSQFKSSHGLGSVYHLFFASFTISEKGFSSLSNSDIIYHSVQENIQEI